MNPPYQQCARCGKTAGPNAKFCPSCGAILAGAVPQVQRLQPGQLLQGRRYCILRTLGKGGMGLVYLAENKQAFDRPCVIKEMLDYFDPNDPQQAASAHQRFEDEARTLSRLNHPGIPGIQAYFSEANHNYIVMDFVDGQNLEQMLGKKLSEIQVINYGVQVCDILKYLAALNPPVVHHDIKPANIIIDAASNRVYLVDFGTAKARLTAQAGGGVGLQKSSIYGTAGYAPPEQYKGQSEPRSDVYALAATMYHLVTDDDPGSHPFRFPQLNKLPPGLRAALQRCFEEVSLRSTAQILGRDLQDLLTAAAKAAQKKSTPPRQSLDVHESYAVVSLQAPPPALRAQVTNILQTQLGIAAADAEVLAWQAPAGYLRYDDGKRAQALVNQLRAAGFNVNLVRTSQVPAWRAGLTQTNLQQLADGGEVAVTNLYFPQDRVCFCHACRHSWTTQAQDTGHLRTTCTKCGHLWYAHRIFRCHICGHEFADANMTQAAGALFAQCPACRAAAWLPQQQPRLTQTVYEIKERMPIGAVKTCQIVLAASPNGVSVQGRTSSSSQWVKTAEFFTGGKLDLTIYSTGLAERQTFQTEVLARTNAGSARITVKVYVEAPPQLAVDPKFMDFGTLKAQETQSFNLVIHNAGDMELIGTVTSSCAWLRLSKTTFRNQETIRCQVTGSGLEKAGVNTGTLLVESNGGRRSIPVKATAAPTTLEIDPPEINLGLQPRRGTVRAKLTVKNPGFGLLEGEASADAPWIQLEQTRFTGNAVDLKLTADLSRLPVGAAATSRLTVVSNGGALEIPIQVDIPRPRGLGYWLRRNRMVQLLLLLLLLGGALAGRQQWGAIQQARGTATPTPNTGSAGAVGAIAPNSAVHLYLPVIYGEEFNTALLSPLPTAIRLLPTATATPVPKPRPVKPVTIQPQPDAPMRRL